MEGTESLPTTMDVVNWRYLLYQKTKKKNKRLEIFVSPSCLAC